MSWPIYARIHSQINTVDSIKRQPDWQSVSDKHSAIHNLSVRPSASTYPEPGPRWKQVSPGPPWAQPDVLFHGLPEFLSDPGVHTEATALVLSSASGVLSLPVSSNGFLGSKKAGYPELPNCAYAHLIERYFLNEVNLLLQGENSNTLALSVGSVSIPNPARHLSIWATTEKNRVQPLYRCLVPELLLCLEVKPIYPDLIGVY